MFEEYITNGTLEQKERARNWQTAIGLQGVDGIMVSSYLIELAREHIEGEISIYDVQEKIEEYHAQIRQRLDNMEIMESE